MTFIPQVPAPLTAFGDLRTAELSPIYQYSFEYTVDNTELTINSVTNGGTVTQADGMAVIGTSTTTNSTACMTSRRHARYRAGQGGNVRFTTLFSSGLSGTEQYVGLLDETGSTAAFKNGYTVGFTGSVFGFQRFQNDTLISVAQSEWDDPLDGTGASGMTLDHSKLNVWQIQYQYLGGGAIILSVVNQATGQYIVVHTVLYANLNTQPSVFNPNFFHTVWANNGGTTTDIIVKTSSFVYFVEGITELINLHQPQFSTANIEKTTVTSEIAIFTIRNKSLYQSKTNFIDILLEDITSAIEANAANNLAHITLTRDATLGGTPSFSDINTSDSVVEIDTAGTTVTGGKVILPSIPLAGKNASFKDNVLPFKIIIAPGESLTLSAVSANSATVNASMLWRELF